MPISQDKPSGKEPERPPEEKAPVTPTYKHGGVAGPPDDYIRQPTNISPPKYSYDVGKETEHTPGSDLKFRGGEWQRQTEDGDWVTPDVVMFDPITTQHTWDHSPTADDWKYLPQYYPQFEQAYYADRPSYNYWTPGRLKYANEILDAIGASGQRPHWLTPEVEQAVRTSWDVMESMGMVSGKRQDWTPYRTPGLPEGQEDITRHGVSDPRTPRTPADPEQLHEFDTVLSEYLGGVGKEPHLTADQIHSISKETGIPYEYITSRGKVMPQYLDELDEERKSLQPQDLYWLPKMGTAEYERLDFGDKALIQAQRLTAIITAKPWLMGAVIGGVGALTGGVGSVVLGALGLGAGVFAGAGMVTGGVFGLAVGATQSQIDPTRWSPEVYQKLSGAQSTIGDSLMILDKVFQNLAERPAGITYLALTGELSEGGAFHRNFGTAWKASNMFVESIIGTAGDDKRMPFPTEVGKAWYDKGTWDDDEFKTALEAMETWADELETLEQGNVPKRLEPYLEQAFSAGFDMVKEGKVDKNDLYNQWQQDMGFDGWGADMLAGMIFDPLNYLAPSEALGTVAMKVLKLSKGETPGGIRALRLADAIEATASNRGNWYQVPEWYGSLMRNDTLNPTMGYMKALGTDGGPPSTETMIRSVAENIAGVQNAEGLGAIFDRMTSGLGKEGFTTQGTKPSAGGKVAGGAIGAGMLGGIGSLIGGMPLGIIGAVVGGRMGFGRGLTGLLSLTPRSRASQATTKFGTWWGTLLNHVRFNTAPEEIPNVLLSHLEQFAKSPQEYAVKTSIYALGGPENSVIPDILNGDVLKDLQVMRDKWYRTEAPRQIFQGIAEMLDMSYHDVIKQMAEGDHLYRMMEAKLEADPNANQELARLIATFDAGGEGLETIAKKMIDGKLHGDLDHFVADYLKTLIDETNKWATKWFGVDKRHIEGRIVNAVKAVQTMALLAWNPNFAVKNIIDNVMVSAFDGHGKFISPDNISDFWTNRVGFEPVRLEAGVGPAGVGGLDYSEALRHQRNANRAGGGLDDATDWINRQNSRIGFATRFSAQAEARASARVMTNAFIQMFTTLNKEGKGFSKMPEPLRDNLEAQFPGMSRDIIGVIESSMNAQEISKALEIGLARRTLDHAAEIMADSIPGRTSEQIMTGLRQMGIYDVIQEGLRTAETPAEVHGVFNDVMQQIVTNLFDNLASEVDGLADAVAGMVQPGAEGNLGVWTLLKDQGYDKLMYQIQHYENYDEIFLRRLEGGDPGQFERELATQRGLARASHGIANIREKALILGIARGLGDLTQSADGLLKLVNEKNVAWDNFHNRTDELHSEFFDNQATRDKLQNDTLWNTIQEELSSEYQKALDIEAKNMGEIDEMLARLIEENYGEVAGQIARDGMGADRGYRDQAGQSMREFRQELRGVKDYSERYGAWKGKVNEIHAEAITKQNSQQAWIDDLIHIITGGSEDDLPSRSGGEPEGPQGEPGGEPRGPQPSPEEPEPSTPRGPVQEEYDARVEVAEEMLRKLREGEEWTVEESQFYDNNSAFAEAMWNEARRREESIPAGYEEPELPPTEIRVQEKAVRDAQVDSLVNTTRMLSGVEEFNEFDFGPFIGKTPDEIRSLPIDAWPKEVQELHRNLALQMANELEAGYIEKKPITQVANAEELSKIIGLTEDEYTKLDQIVRGVGDDPEATLKSLREREISVSHNPIWYRDLYTAVESGSLILGDLQSLPQKSTIVNALKAIAEGKTKKTKSFSVIEGWVKAGMLEGIEGDSRIPPDLFTNLLVKGIDETANIAKNNPEALDMLREMYPALAERLAGVSDTIQRGAMPQQPTRAQARGEIRKIASEMSPEIDKPWGKPGEPISDKHILSALNLEAYKPDDLKGQYWSRLEDINPDDARRILENRKIAKEAGYAVDDNFSQRVADKIEAENIQKDMARDINTFEKANKTMREVVHDYAVKSVTTSEESARLWNELLDNMARKYEMDNPGKSFYEDTYLGAFPMSNVEEMFSTSGYRTPRLEGVVNVSIEDLNKIDLGIGHKSDLNLDGDITLFGENMRYLTKEGVPARWTVDNDIADILIDGLEILGGDVERTVKRYILQGDRQGFTNYVRNGGLTEAWREFTGGTIPYEDYANSWIDTIFPRTQEGGGATKIEDFSHAIVPEEYVDTIKRLRDAGVEVWTYGEKSGTTRADAYEDFYNASTGGVTGSTRFQMQDNLLKSILYSFDGADIDTVIEENFHAFRRKLITGTDNDVLAEWAGAERQPDGSWKWTVEAEEKSAEGFKKYLYEGNAPFPELQKIFDSIKQYLMMVYRKLGLMPDVELTPEVREVFDGLFMRDAQGPRALDQGARDAFQIKVGPEEPFDIFVNPTPDDYQAIKQQYRDRYFRFPENNDVWIRTTRDADGNIYAWMAGNGVHQHVEPAIKDLKGIDVDQTLQPPRGEVQTDMFAQTNEDLPLFSGTAEKGEVSKFEPKDIDDAEQLELFQKWETRGVKWDSHKGEGTQSWVRNAVDQDHGTTLWMSPDDYLSLHHDIPEGQEKYQVFGHDTTEEYVQGMADADKVWAPPWMSVYWVEGKGWVVDAHEGRHRARMAGTIAPDEDIPVVVAFRENVSDIPDERKFAPIYPDENSKKVQPWDPQGGFRITDTTEENITFQREDGTTDTLALDQTRNDTGAGAMRPGDYERELGFSPDFMRAEEEAMIEEYLPYLRELSRQLQGEDAQYPGRIMGQQINDATSGQLQSYLRKINGEQSSLKLLSADFAEGQRDWALHNYGKEYGLDEIAEVAMPYHLWYTRAFLKWGIRAMSKPGYLARFARLTSLNTSAPAPEGFPSRLQGKMRIPTGWLPEWAQPSWMGEQVYIDPYKALYPVRQLMDGWDYQTREKNSDLRQVYYELESMVSNEKISGEEMSEAIQTQAGPVWEEAVLNASDRMEAGELHPFQFVEAISGFHIPLEMIRTLRSGKDMRHLPISRFLKQLTSTIKPGGMPWVYAPIRMALGKHPDGELGPFYTVRELGNMVADGEITLDQARMAGVQATQGVREGDVIERALKRIDSYNRWRYFGQIIGVDLFPKGEEEMRMLGNEFYQTLDTPDPNDTRAFFEKYPEYEARLMLNNWSDPENMLKEALENVIWEKYLEADDVTRRMAREQFGTNFGTKFLDQKNIELIPTEELATWAKFLGGDTFGALYGTEVTNPLVEEATMTAYNEYLAQAGQQGFDLERMKTLQDFYYVVPEARRYEFLKKFPDYRRWRDFKAVFMKDNPELIDAIGSKWLQDLEEDDRQDYFESVERRQAKDTIPYVDMSQFPDEVLQALMAHYYTGYNLGEGSMMVLKDYWTSMGSPGTLNYFINTVLRANSQLQ